LLNKIRPERDRINANLPPRNQRYLPVAKWHKSGFSDFHGKSIERFPAKTIYPRSLPQTPDGGIPAALLSHRIAHE
jgi:hypothetical protein